LDLFRWLAQLSGTVCPITFSSGKTRRNDATDADQLAYAASQNLTLVTRNRVNFEQLAAKLGIMSQFAVSDILNGLLVLDRTGIPETDTVDFGLQYGADEDASAQFGIPPKIASSEYARIRGDRPYRKALT